MCRFLQFSYIPLDWPLMRSRLLMRNLSFLMNLHTVAYNIKLPRGHMWFCWSLFSSTNRQHKYSAKHTEKKCSVNKGRKYSVWTVLVVPLGIWDQTNFVNALCNWTVGIHELLWSALLSCHLQYEFRHLTYWVLSPDYCDLRTKQNPHASIMDIHM